MVWALESLVEEYEAALSSKKSMEEALHGIEASLETARAALTALPETLRYEIAARLKTVRDYVAASSYDKARLEASTVCRQALQALARAVAEAHVEVEECPPPDAVKAVVAVVNASGPLAPVTRSLLRAGATTFNDVAYNARRIATRWEDVSRQLLSIYNAGRSLEARELAKIHDVVLLASKLVEAESFEAALEHLEAVAARLTEVAQLFEALGSSMSDLSEALNICREGMGAETPLCRWLSRVIGSILSAYDSASDLMNLSGLEDLVAVAARIRKAYERLSATRRLLEKLSSSIASAAGVGVAASSMRKAMEAIAAGRERLGLTPQEEELLIELVERDVLDLLEVYRQGRERLEAALRLCSHGLARCSLHAY